MSENDVLAIAAVTIPAAWLAWRIARARFTDKAAQRTAYVKAEAARKARTP